VCRRARAAQFLALPAFLAAAPAPGQVDPGLRTPEVVVSAASADGTARAVPHGVSVITAQDIARSSSITLGELLGQEANLNLQSFSGSDRRSTVDMRGMGATATSNVLILVDGVRLNETDLSGADLSTVPLSQIERIEVVRGGGAVRWGDGAVAGVINIVTRRAGTGSTGGAVQARAGSYSTTDLRFDARAAAGAWSSAVNLAGLETDGYRDNGFVSSRNAAASVRWLPDGALDFLSARLEATQYRDHSGLPGPVSAADFAAGESARRATRFPNDESRTTDSRVTGGLGFELGAAGSIDLQLALRSRENSFLIGFNPVAPRALQQGLIESRRADLQLRYRVPLDEGRVRLEAGLDARGADYARSGNGVAVPGSTRQAGEVDTRGAFLSGLWQLPAGVSLTAGVREERTTLWRESQSWRAGACRTVTETIQVDVDPGPGVVLVPVVVTRQVDCRDFAYRADGAASRETWRNSAAELGLAWQTDERLLAFASVSRHFRTPNVDELALAAPSLRPQTGRTVEGGVRWVAPERGEAGLTLFHMVVEDEIAFFRDPVAGLGLNRNFVQPTHRSGFEAELRWRPWRRIAVRASLGWVDARFAGGAGEVPLVPRETAAAELEWSPREALRASLGVRHVGSRRDGNDLDGAGFPRLPPYTVVDVALRRDFGNVQIAAGINNLLNEVYSTIAYSATYYPMPGRNGWLQVRWRL
jgi:outer membrane receptor protein involved in Fe transport